MISEAMLPADRLAGDFPISLLLIQYRCWRTKIIVAAVTDSQSPQKKTELNELFKKNVDLGLHSSATAKILDEWARAPKTAAGKTSVMATKEASA